MKYIYNLFIFLFLSSNLNAQKKSVGIGTDSPDSSSILELFSSNKGIMIPQISLNENDMTDASFMASTPTESLLIYNTNGNVSGGKGLYYWSGTKWLFYFNSANINLLLGITKYEAKTYSNGISTNVYNTELSSVNSFVNGSPLVSPWVEIVDSVPLKFTMDRSPNNAIITFTGMLQLNNTSSSNAYLNYGLGIFVDDKLVGSKAAVLVADNTCSFQEFTITGMIDDLTVGDHTVTLAVMNRSSNTTSAVNYGQKAPSCSSISSDEAKISAIVLINQPLPY